MNCQLQSSGGDRNLLTMKTHTQKYSFHYTSYELMIITLQMQSEQEKPTYMFNTAPH